MGMRPVLTTLVRQLAESHCKKSGKSAEYTGIMRDSGFGPEEYDFRCVGESKTTKVTKQRNKKIKNKAVVVPIEAIGSINNSQKTIILNRFLDELSNDYDILPQEEYERAEERAFQELDYEECTEEQCIRLIQEMLQVENMFFLQLIRENDDTQVSLTLIDLDRKIVKSNFCEGCKTSALIKTVSKLFQELTEKI